MAVQNFVKVSQDHKHIIVKSGGLRGSEGPQGPQGPAGTVTVGTTSTLAPDSAATVTNTGTSENAILNFGIPKGSKGDKGDQGIQGPKGDPGAGLVITGSVDTYAELPSGFGPDDAGKAYFVQADGKLYVWSGTQWPAEGDGAQFEGPKGDTGATGAQGPAGYSPSASVVKVGDTTTITITDEHGTTTANVNDGTPITVDAALSTSSTNPVQNQVITNKLNTAAFVGSTVVGGTSLIDTSDIATGAITTTKIADGAVTSDKIDSATYSTSRKAVGTWIDGRTIYRKTVHITSPSTSNAYYGVVDADLIQGLYICGYMNASSGAEDYTIPVPQTDSSSTYSVILFVGKQLRGRFAFSSGVPSDVWVNVYYLIEPAP